MATVYLLEAAPRIVATGATTTVHMAGGGSRPYSGYLGFTDWLAGLVELPKFNTEVGFDERGWNGGAVPQSAAIKFATIDLARAAALAAYSWKGARITLSSGDDTFGAPGSWTTEIVGTVDSEPTIDAGTLTLVVTDLAGDLGKPIAPLTFAGSGGIEGPVEIAGRVKRRSWGRVFSVEGQILDKANGIYEFGDPAQPLNSFEAVKDKGRTGPMTTVAWAGTIAATFAALQAAVAPQGGAAVAPSIACAKWWTTPSGPLTADLKGEVGTGYVETAIGIAARVVSAVSSLSTGFTINATRAYAVGVHCDNASETAQSVLDRILLGCGLIWTLDPTGVITIGQFTWSSPVESLVSHSVARDAGFPALKTRSLGYQINNRIHSDSEISAALTDLPADGENLVANPNLAGGPDGWFMSGTVLWAAGTAGTPTAGVFVLTSGASLTDANKSQKLPTGSAKKLFGNVNVYRDAGATGTLQLIIYWYKADGTASATANTSMSVFPVTTGAWIKGLGGVFDVPADAAMWLARLDANIGGSGQVYTGGLRIATTQPSADVTADNQTLFGDVPDINLSMDSSGAFAGGTFPFTVPVRLLKGGVDISDSAAWSKTDNDVTSSVDTVTAGHRGDYTVTAKGGEADTNVTIKATFGGIDYFKQFKVTVTRAGAPAGGGGGGGGSPGAPASTSTFTAPGTSGSSVVAATLAAVMVGSSGNVGLSVGLSFEQQNSDGTFADASFAGSTTLAYAIERSVNGGAFGSVTSGSGGAAQKFFQNVTPKGIKNYPGSLGVTFTDTGRTNGDSIVYRLKLLASPTTYGVSPVTGTMTATPA